MSPSGTPRNATPEALLAVVELARQAGDLGLARRTLNEARSLFPGSPEIHFAFARDCLLDNDIDRAREAFARVVELDPGNVRAWINYGATCGQAEYLDEAVRALERALDLDPASRDATSNLGVLRREAGRLPEAEALFRTAIALDAAFFPAYYNLAHTLFLLGNYEASADAYRQGLKLDPFKAPGQQGRLAWSLLAAGLDSEAQDQLTRALGRMSRDERLDFRRDGESLLQALEARKPGLRGLESARRTLRSG